MEKHFEIGDTVCVGNDTQRGKIVNKQKPFGTFATRYTVQLFHDGTFVTASKHELVKGMDDNDFNHLISATNLPSIINSSLNSVSIVPNQVNTTSTSTTSTSAPPVTPPPLITQNAYEVNSEPIPDDVAYILSQLLNDDHDLVIDEHAPAINLPVYAQNSRFKSFTDTEIDQFIYEHENESTRRKTLGHVKLLTQFINEQGDNRELNCIPPSELNDILCKFFVGVRQRNGDEYEPSYLRGMLGSFERHLKKSKYTTSLISGLEFSKARELLKGKQKNLKKQGKGNLPKRADSINDQEVLKLFENGCLGASTPKSLLNTMWYNNTLHFGIRGGGEEHRTLQWGDICLQYDSELEMEYLEYNERQTKTRTGQDVRNVRDSKPRMYAVPESSRCPIKMYKAYKDKRPNDFNAPDKPFYLAAVTHTANPKENEQWFLRAPLGRNKISKMMKDMVKDGGLPDMHIKRLTNTSVRKQLCQKLLDNNIPDGQACHITGHKNPASLNNYRVLNNKRKAEMSNLLDTTDTEMRPTLIAPATTVPNDETAPRQTFSNSRPLLAMPMDQHNQSMNLNPSDVLQSIFYGSTINGGTFNVNINFGSNDESMKQKHARH